LLTKSELYFKSYNKARYLLKRSYSIKRINYSNNRKNSIIKDIKHKTESLVYITMVKIYWLNVLSKGSNAFLEMEVQGKFITTNSL